MNRFLIIVLIAAPAFCAELSQPWDAPYTGDDAAGKHVIALWKFDADAQTKDSSGHGLDCSIDGATINPAGKFGAALESACGWPVTDKRHRAIVKNNPRLTPKGAFTVEMWICPGKELAGEYGDSFLLDKKYVAHADYQLILSGGEKTGNRTLLMHLGFGEDSATWRARPMRFETGAWYHIAFTYDGAGTGAFVVNGQPAGATTIPGRANIVAGNHPLSIGDRIGSYYHGFPGLIDEVRLSGQVLEFRRISIQRTSDRACFVRMEKDAAVRFEITNLSRQPLADAAASVAISTMPPREFKLASLAPGAAQTIDFPLDTSLRPDVYSVRVHAKSAAIQTQDQFPIRLVSRPVPDRFPVVMWGIYGSVQKEMERLKRIGFTHVLGLGADYDKIWAARVAVAPTTPDKVKAQLATLDDALANDIVIAASLSPGHSLTKHKDLLRVNRKGQSHPTRPDICALNPDIEAFCYNVGASVARAYGHHPALGAALIHTEVRDAAGLCFHPRDFEAYKKFSGQDIPAEAAGKNGVDYTKLKDFPASRVIPDDHPILNYYRWFWKHGDGWNALNSAVHKGLKSTGRNDLWTWHDPAVRVAKTWGSGGDIDVLSQWTYSYPDPIRIAVATDELFAMAAGSPAPRQVMKMTQIIWYRGQTAPMAKPGGNAPAFQADWERQQPDAPFITIAPMHLREAFWTKIARPIRGIMYHGWQSLVPCEGAGGYRFTNPQTQHELSRLIQQVVRPLGPTLLNIPPANCDVAVLQSFASEMFARRGTYGWCGKWSGDAYHVVLYAGLQPQIVYDETITERGMDGIRVLVMPDCDVITRKMADRIKAFQSAGGIIVGDDHTAPAIKPDIVLTPYTRAGRNDDDKKALLALADQLRKQLDAKYTRYVDSNNPNIIPYRRGHKTADYVFVVNDHREYGNYVGHHALVMENGLPSSATLRINRPDGIIYDLVNGCEVPARKDAGRLVADVQLGPCDGRLYMVIDRPVQAVRIAGPAAIERGGQAKFVVNVVDPDGKPIQAIIPVELLIRDAEGKTAEFSGFYAAVNGKLEFALDIAANDAFGSWQIEARDLASRHAAVHSLKVSSPGEWPPAKRPIPRELADPVQPKG